MRRLPRELRPASRAKVLRVCKARKPPLTLGALAALTGDTLTTLSRKLIGTRPQESGFRDRLERALGLRPYSLAVDGYSVRANHEVAP